MDPRSNRRNFFNQKPVLVASMLLLTTTMISMYVLIGRRISSFEDAVLAVGEHITEQSMNQKIELQNLIFEMKNDTRDTLDRLATKIGRQTSKLNFINLKIEDWDMMLKSFKEAIKSQNISTQDNLRLQKKMMLILFGIKESVNKQNDFGTGFQESIEDKFEKISNGIFQNKEMSKASHSILESIIEFETSQKSVSTDDQEKIHSVLKALVSHLKKQQELLNDNSNQLVQKKIQKTVHSILQELQNQTKLSAIGKNVQAGNEEIEKLRKEITRVKSLIYGSKYKTSLQNSQNFKNASDAQIFSEIFNSVTNLNYTLESFQSKIDFLYSAKLKEKDETETDKNKAQSFFDNFDENDNRTFVEFLISETKKQTDMIESLSSRLDGLEISLENGGKTNISNFLTNTKKRSIDDFKKNISSNSFNLADLKLLKQRAIAGNANFFRFSSYRFNTHEFVSIGFNLNENDKLPKVENCIWIAGENQVQGSGHAYYVKEKNKNGNSNNNNNNNYDVILIKCIFDNDVDQKGGYLMATINNSDYVLYNEKDEEFSNVRNSPAMEEGVTYVHNVTLCAAPMRITHQSQIRLVREFVEYHAFLGIPHVVFYVAGEFFDNFAQHFKHDVEQGSVKIIPYFGMDDYLHDLNSQTLSIHDCVFQHRFSSKWVMELEINEYLSLAPSSSLSSILQTYSSSSWLTHGSLFWSSFKCSPPLENQDSKNDKIEDSFLIERMIYHWPHLVCHDTQKFPKLDMCLGVMGHRKWIVDPRKVFRLHVYEVNTEDAPIGTDLSTNELVQNYFQNFFDEPNVCSELFTDNSTVDWWTKDFRLKEFASQLRKNAQCDFNAGRCLPLENASRSNTNNRRSLL